MKSLELILGVALNSFCHCPPEPVIPHPIPSIAPIDKNDSSPEIILTYNNDLPCVMKGQQDIVLKSRTYGGTLKIELSDSDVIQNYYFILNGHHLACSTDDHPGNPKKSYIRKQYAVPLHGVLLIAVEDEKGNSSRTIVQIEKE